MNTVIEPRNRIGETGLVERDMPLIFDSHTPRHAIASAIVSHNRQLHELPGEGYFVELPTREVLYGETVYVSVLMADEVAWNAYRRAHASLVPTHLDAITYEPEPDEDIDPVALFASA